MWQREDRESETGEREIERDILFSSEVLKAPCRHYFLHPASFAIVSPLLMAMTHNKLSLSHTHSHTQSLITL